MSSTASKCSVLEQIAKERRRRKEDAYSHRVARADLGCATKQGLDRLKKLRVLSIQSNRITKLEGLEGLENLEELYISHNGLTKLEGLENNLKLTTLDIAGNKIKEIANVGHLAQMEEFWANSNAIEDLHHIDEQLGVARMPHLNTVYFELNPVQRKEGAAYRRKLILALPQVKQIDATLTR